MSSNCQIRLAEIEATVCDIAADVLNFPRVRITPASRLVEDLDGDSLDFIELIMELEDHFHVTIPTDGSNVVCKSLFARKDFSLADLSQMVYVQQGSGKPERGFWNRGPQADSDRNVPFCQLSGVWDEDQSTPLFEELSHSGSVKHFRRRSDGMRCIQLPAATVTIGTNDASFDCDARPQHFVELGSFLIDAEVVSTTAYCRFLNSIGPVDDSTLRDWFVLSEEDDRVEHQLVHLAPEGWSPFNGCERLPMILVSWYGANAYSRWANSRDWQNYRGHGTSIEDHSSFLPTEAQWEYAARGATYRAFPWTNEDSDTPHVNAARHQRGQRYDRTSLPLLDVTAESGMSPFGLNQMAGNVWQWCRDWYRKDFYSDPAASCRNACAEVETGIRSERGGSWVGPMELCRSSYRRGRSPFARGRCLGFRCVSEVPTLQSKIE